MSCTIKTKNGKLFGITDCENEFVVINNKKIPLSDVYSDKELFDEFNDEIKNSSKDLTDE